VFGIWMTEIKMKINDNRLLSKNYQWILFDADGTLFHFDAFSGLKQAFASLGIQFTKKHYRAYQAINKSLWVDYQNGHITAQQLQNKRFETWGEKLKIKPEELNRIFLMAMADICVPIDGAVNLLQALKNKVRLGIVTNGFTELQEIRLQRTGLRDYFEVLVISEQVGVAKPHPDIFDHALSMMGNPDRNKVLMVGDNPDADIVGGINAGLDTCWLNMDNQTIHESIVPNYQVSSLFKLEELLVDTII
jgi:YjjG family noncanonical pyrimidine nucleotidase